MPIAAGNGKGTNADRRRFFAIARGSALACASLQDCLEACAGLPADHNERGKAMLVRMVSMLAQLARRNHAVRDDSGRYEDLDYDNDAKGTP